VALYDFILKQNLAESDVEYQEVFPNLALGDPNYYNLVVAGENGVPRLPNKTIQERYADGSEEWWFEVDSNVVNIKATKTNSQYIMLFDQAILINDSTDSRIFIYNYLDGTGHVEVGAPTHNYILLNSTDGDLRIDNLNVLTTPNEKTLYIDSTDYNRVKYRNPESAIPNYKHAPWVTYGTVAEDPDARAKIDELIAVVNGILTALRAHKVIMG